MRLSRRWRATWESTKTFSTWRWLLISKSLLIGEIWLLCGFQTSMILWLSHHHHVYSTCSKTLPFNLNQINDVFHILPSYNLICFPFQETSRRGRDSTGVPFPSCPKLNSIFLRPSNNRNSPHQSSLISRHMCPCATQEVPQKSPFFYTRTDRVRCTAVVARSYVGRQ